MLFPYGYKWLHVSYQDLLRFGIFKVLLQLFQGRPFCSSWSAHTKTYLLWPRCCARCPVLCPLDGQWSLVRLFPSLAWLEGPPFWLSRFHLPVTLRVFIQVRREQIQQQEGHGSEGCGIQWIRHKTCIKRWEPGVGFVLEHSLLCV